jgi:hypothetical protein
MVASVVPVCIATLVRTEPVRAKLRSGARTESTACPELVEGAQAVGRNWNQTSPSGAKETFLRSRMP